MGLVIKQYTLERFLNFLLNLDAASKKKIIKRLKESMDAHERRQPNLDRFAGAWKDLRSSEEIISDIKNSRMDKSDLIDM